MQKNFTQLIAHFLSAKRYTVPAGALLLFLVTSLFIWADVLPGTTVVKVDADYADQGANPRLTTAFPIGNIVINENNGMIFQRQGSTQSGTITLNLPSPATNWMFDTSPNLVSVNVNNGGQSNFSATLQSISTTSIVINISNIGNNNTVSDILTISGVRVRPVVGTINTANEFVDITYAESFDLNAGLANGSVLARLQKVPGAIRKLGFGQQPTNANVLATISPAPTVLVQDQFGNTATNATGNISLALTGSPSSALITSGGTATVTNGVAQFNDIRIDEGGNFRLLATYSPSVQGTSNEFAVNNLVPSNIASITCITAGGPINTVSVTGTNFVRGSVVQIAYPDAPTIYVNKPTLFVNTGALTADLSGDIAVARTLKLRVLNPVPQGGASTAIDFVIRPALTAGPITGPTAVCSNSPTAYTFSIDAIPGAISYNWEVPAGVTVTGVSTGSSVQISFGATAPAEVTVSVAPRNACSVLGTAATHKVKVNQYPTSVDAGDNRSICLGETTTLGSGQPAVAGYTYSWSPATGLSDASSPNPTVTLGNSTATVQPYTYTLSVKNGEAACEVQDQVTINVYPEFVVAAGHLKPVCVSEALNLTATGDDSYTYRWTGPNGFTSSERNPTITSVTASNAGRYEVTVTNLNLCVASSFTDVEVVSKPTADAGADQDKCATGNSTSFTLNGSTSEGSGIWSVVAGSATISNETSLTTGVTIASGSATLRLTAINTSGCETFDDIALTVNPLPTAVIEQGSATYFCRSGGTAVLSAQAGAGYKYVWYNVTTTGDVVVDNDSDPNNNQRIEVATVGDYYVVVTGGNTCVSTSSRISVQSVVVNNNSLTSTDQEICYGASLGLTGDNASPSEPGATLTYQWQQSADGVDYTNITGANDVKLNLTSVTATTWYRRLAIVGSCSDESTPVKVTVLPQIVNTLTAADQTICQSGSAQTITGSPATGGNGAGSYTYTWYQRAGNGTWGVAPGTSTGESYTPQVSATAGVYSFRRDVKSGTCAPVESNVVTVTVLSPISGNAISGTQAYCQGATASALSSGNLSGGTGSYTYVWQQSATNTPTSTWGPAAGTNTQPSYTPPTADAGTMYYRRVVTSGDCSSTSEPLAVTVNPQPSVTASAPVEIKCVGASNTTTFELTGTATNGTPSWSFVSGSATGTAAVSSFSSPSTGSTQVTVTGTGSLKVRLTSSSTVSGCNAAFQDVTLTVAPQPTAMVTSGSQALCVSTDNKTTFNVTGTYSGGTPQWISSNTSSFVIGSPVFSNGTATATVVATGTGTATITLQTSNTTSACNTASSSVSLTVNPQPSVTASALVPTKCVGANNTTVFDLTGTATNGTPSWSFVSGSATGTAAVSSFSSPSTGSTQVTVTGTGSLKVRLTSSSTVGGCSAAFRDVTLTVRPQPVAGPITTLSGVASKCIGANNTTVFNLRANFVGDNAKFTSDNTSFVVSNEHYYYTTGEGVITYTIVGEGIATVTFTVTNGSTGCSPVTRTITLEAKPLPSTQGVVLTSRKTAYTADAPYQLTASVPGAVFSGPGVNSTTGMFTPCTAGAGDKNITITLTGANGCTNSTTDVIKVTQSTYTVIISADPFPICKGQNTTYTARVYRDAVVVYPYLENPALITKTNRAVTYNPAYDPYLPIGWQPIHKQFPARYFQPKVVSGVEQPIDNFTYQWTKNEAQNVGGDRDYFGQAGLSSTDYYKVYVTEKTAKACVTRLQSQLSNPMFIAEPEGYQIAVSAAPSTICKGAGTIFTAFLDGTFPWATSNLKLTWKLRRGGTVYDIKNVDGVTNSDKVGNNYELYLTSAEIKTVLENLKVADTDLVQGDEIFVEFNTDIEKIGTQKCRERQTSVQPVVMTVNQPVAVTPQSQDQTVCVGGSATFSATHATGTALIYQWYRGTTPVGINSPTLNISNAQLADGGQYSVKVSNMCTTEGITVNIGFLTINTPPDISTQPSAVTVCEGSGSNATFSVIASGSGIGYQWMKNGVDIPNATNATYIIATPTETDEATYSVRLIGTTACGNKTSNGALLTVNQPVSAAPGADQNVCANSQVNFSVTASGTGLSYQWFKGTIPVGTNSSALTIASADVEDSGVYSVVVTGTCTSNGVTVPMGTLTVNPNILANGEFYIEDEDGNEITEGNPMKVGESVTYTAVTNIGVNNNEVASYYWETSNNGKDWTSYPDKTKSDQLTITVPNADLYVRLEIVPMESGCYINNLVVIEPGRIVPLPVEILYLKASKQGNDVLLEWATASEQDNKGFEVQVSEDGLNYRALTFVASRNSNSSTKQSYTYTDKENGKSGTRYYRLKQIDHSGTSEFFGPKVVAFDKVASKVIAFPNPFNDEITLDIASEVDGEMLVVVTDAVGKHLLQRKVLVASGFTTEKLKLDAGLPVGLYIIKTQIGGYTQFIKMVKE